MAKARDGVSGQFFRAAPGVETEVPSGRLSVYWLLPETLPLPTGYTSTLVDTHDGSLFRDSRVHRPDASSSGPSDDADADWSTLDSSDLLHRDLVAAARYTQGSSVSDAVTTLADLAHSSGLPHATFEGGPEWTGDDGFGVAYVSGEGETSSGVAWPRADPEDPAAADGRADGALDVEVEDRRDPVMERLQGVLRTGGGPRTVVHLVVAIDPEPTGRDFDLAINEAVDLVHSTVVGIHEVTGYGWRQPMPEAEPLHLMTGLDRIENNELIPVWGLSLYAPRIQFHFPPVELNEEELGSLARAEIHAGQHSRRSLVADLRRAAVNAARRTADPRTAIVMSAATCESWIDLVIASMLWEEKKTPEEGAEELSRYRDSQQRLHQLLGPRLGGSWDLSKVPPLRAWDEDVREARNRVVHAGGLPSVRLGERSVNAMYAFLTYTLDRLCSSKTRNRYPISAVLLAHRVGLESRQGWTRKIRDAATEADTYALGEVFNHWYAAMEWILLPDRMRRPPDENARPELARLSDGRAYWIQHDWNAHLARLIDVDPELTRILDRQNPPNDPRISNSLSFDLIVPFEPVGDWVQEHRLFPRTALLRDPRRWDIPPDAPLNALRLR